MFDLQTAGLGVTELEKLMQLGNQGHTEDMINLVALNNHLIVLQAQAIKMGEHLIKVQTRLDQLERWAEKRGS